MNKQKLSNKERLQKDELLSFLFGADTEDVKKLSKFFEGYATPFRFNIIKDDGAKESVEYKAFPSVEKQQQDSKVDSDKIVKPQKGDEVLILDSPEGIKNVKGIIVDEIKATEQFLVKLSEINALYVDKDKVQVIEKKQNVEEINKLKEKIQILKDCKDVLINEIQYTTEQIKYLEQSKNNTQQSLKQTTKDIEQYKQQLEELEGR